MDQRHLDEGVSSMGQGAFNKMIEVEADFMDSKKTIAVLVGNNTADDAAAREAAQGGNTVPLKVKVLETHQEEEPAKIALVIGDDTEDAAAARGATQGGDAVPESTPSSFSEDLFVVD